MVAGCVAAAVRDPIAALASFGCLVLVSFGEGVSLSRVSSSPTPSPLDSPTVRVLTYNVAKWETGATAIAQAIESADPDIVCLEEAGRYYWLHAYEQTPDALAQRLPGYRLDVRDVLVLDVDASDHRPVLALVSAPR
jgi:endonuclease/exonuclease/phosphatase (EEP) superfamily protein YafD